jgi:hypothetical protein
MTLTPAALPVVRCRRDPRGAHPHRRPDRPPPSRRHLGQHDRVDDPQLRQGGLRGAGPRGHHRDVPAPDQADGGAGTRRIAAAQQLLPADPGHLAHRRDCPTVARRHRPVVRRRGSGRRGRGHAVQRHRDPPPRATRGGARLPRRWPPLRHRALSGTRPRRWAAVLLALAVVPVAAGATRLVELAGGPPVLPVNPRIAASPAAAVIHIARGALYLLAASEPRGAPSMDDAGLRPRRGSRHPGLTQAFAEGVVGDGELSSGLALGAGWVINLAAVEYVISRHTVEPSRPARIMVGL